MANLDNLLAQALVPYMKLVYLPRLNKTGKNPDFFVWKRAWKIAFKYMSVLDVIENDADKSRRDQATLLLIQAVDESLLSVVMECETPALAWKRLADLFDSDTDVGTFSRLGDLVQAKMCKDKPIKEHLVWFDRAWNQMSLRLTISDSSWAAALRPMFQDDIIKGAFFTFTLPVARFGGFVSQIAREDDIAFSAVSTKLKEKSGSLGGWLGRSR